MKTYALEQHPKIDDLIQEISSGEEVVLTNHEKPVAKVIPFTATEKKNSPKFGSVPGIWMSPNFDEPLDDFKDYMA